ncbi:MAG TPA: cyclase family protein [Microbacteriaceae bacterium]|nr:cyclase family protein [Microbacteriaceae bacterium]
MTELPRYRDLPRTAEGAPIAWGLWGDDDDLGLMNLLTPEKAIEGARAARTGRIFPFDIPLGTIDPPFFGRGRTEHVTEGHLGATEEEPSLGLDDKLDNYYLQSASQWDSLGHVGVAFDRYWNGRSTREVRGGRNTIDHVAARGIATRGVLLDLAAVVAERGGPGESVAITADDLEAARAAAGVEIRPGDILVLHTGYLEWYERQPRAVREQQADGERITTAGLAHDEAVAEYLWDLHIAAVASDGVAAEVWPIEPETSPFGFMHQVLIGGLGMMLGELWRTGPLARDCAADGVHEFLLTAAPLPVIRGIGSPANAIAVR